MKSRYPIVIFLLVLLGTAFIYHGHVRGLKQDLQKLEAENASLKGSLDKLTEENRALHSRLTPPVRQSWVSIDDDAVMGDDKAPITMVEFSEFQCPYCARFSSQAFRQIKEKYIDSGTLKFIFRDYPLSIHENASKAAEAAECAGDQGMYWEMHELLFANHTKIGTDDLKQYAESLGLFMPDFIYCLESGKNTAEVEKDIQDGKRAGVTSTPSFFIGPSREDGRILGTFIKGAKPFGTYEQIIERQLKASRTE